MSERKMLGAVVQRHKLGAFDEPGIPLFAIPDQQPLDNMLHHLVRLPPGSTDHLGHYCPIAKGDNGSTGFVANEVRYQVNKISKERTAMEHPYQLRLEKDKKVAEAMAALRNAQLVKDSKFKQLYDHHDIRSLQKEIARARAAVTIKKQRATMVDRSGEIKEAQRIKAAAARKQLERDLIEEKMAAIAKARQFSGEVVIQMMADRKRAQAKQELLLEEGKLNRSLDMAAYARDVAAVEVKKLEQKKELKKMLDDFLEEQKKVDTMKQQQPADCELMLLDTLNPDTNKAVQQNLQNRLNSIDMRERTSQRLGAYLIEVRQAKEKREKLLVNLRVYEKNAKEDQIEFDIKNNSGDRMRKLRDELLQHREKIQLFRARKEAVDNILPCCDGTCFFERQYRLYDDLTESLHKRNKHTYNVLAALKRDNARRREELAQEDEALRNHFLDIQAQMDQRVAEERKKLLAKEPTEVLKALSHKELTDEEIATLNGQRHC